VILYLDTSAFVPLLIDEPTSHVCGEFWDGADRLVTTRLTYVEAAAALAMAERIGRIAADEHAAARQRLLELWPEVDVVELDVQLMVAAADAARGHGLRGYDSVHLAAAVTIDDEDLVAAAGDERLLDAWRADGIAVVDTNAPKPGPTSNDEAETPGDDAP
jgi:uncharacterized protein